MNDLLPAASCDRCGTHLRPPRLTLRYMATRVREEVFGLERGLLRTLWHLLAAPRRVTEAFLLASDRRYFGPFKLFLVATATSLLLMPTGPLLDGMLVTAISRSARLAPEQVAAWVADWNALLYAPLMLLLALSTRMFFRASKLNLAEHVVIAAYGWSQLLLVSTAAMLAAAGFKSIGIRGVWLLPLLFLPAFYWFWFCGSVFRIRSFADWVRCFASLPFAVIGYSLGLALLAAALAPLLGHPGAR